MITFETQLKKLKYLVLKEVAKMTLEHRLNKEELERMPFEIINKDKAEYRCCVYKERAIVYERAKLAMGCLPNGQIAEELVNVEDEDQIVYIIDPACDKCPINRFVVTEACRGCIQHRCVEVCPAGAITRAAGRAYINHETCKECGLCKEVCPYNAVAEVMRPCRRVCPTGALKRNVDDNKAEINKEECINCGACMSACPFGAISDKSFIVDVTRALMDNKKIYAIVAPAIAGQFGPEVKVEQIKEAFKKIGFKDMIEVACGADAVSVHEGNELIERLKNGDKFMTNSCCPGFFNYIEKKFPDLVDKISGTVSPMVATGRMIKKMDEDAVVVFIGPCTAKKNEVKRASIKDAVDYVMTFEEIVALMGAYDTWPSECEGIEVNDGSVFGRGFAQGGGVTSAIQNYVKGLGTDLELKPVRASGADEVKRTMIMAKVGRLSGNFIEGMMCEGGCIGGPATMAPMVKVKSQLAKFSKESDKKDVVANNMLEKFEGVNLER
ncbi:4Fe-4S dicluster domain-containing protein [Clostridium sp. MSJ-11]|uniref:4Fe-4S dicluster domain-containing protein n=1 Tax=Clostridium mobile TaxID=2841512 RepID=A0ABS6EJF2_9CLOT|nr:4Fe-4S dicluster domain-containing protein [Clostridium mobile]MBU5485331.1 4Fe-4S dicluster domain-containing protein [Clostridium mobile]